MKAWDRFGAAVAFLTRFTLPGSRPLVNLRAGVVYYPLVGAGLGSIMALVAILMTPWWPAGVGAAVLVVLEMGLTGGLHLDGLADSADGLWAGHTRERALEIMKDSRIGGHGATALAGLLLLKYTLYLHLWGQNPWMLLAVLAMSRWCLVLALNRYPYARPAGLGSQWLATGSATLVGASIWALAAILMAAGWIGLMAALVTVVMAISYCRWVCHRLGGMTGDTYGALAEISIVGYMLVYLALT